MTVRGTDVVERETGAPTTRLPRAGRMRRPQRGGVFRVPIFLAVPALFLMVAVHYVAPLSGAWYSLTDWGGVGGARFVGLANFQEVLSTPVTRGALRNTLTLAAVFWAGVNVIGLGLALGLNRLVKTRILLRGIFFLPAAMSPIAVSYVWRFVFSFDGPLNRVLGAIGLESWQRVWLADPTWALWCVAVLMIWQYSGLTMVIYLAGLQSIPHELYEAARVDGASGWMSLRRVTFPLLAPAFTVASTLTLIFGLRVFDQVVALTGGGPMGSTETLATQVWKQTWVNGRFGYGAALALILTLLIAVIAMTQVAVLRQREVA